MSQAQLPAPGLPASPNLLDPSTLFVLYYRHGSNPNCSKTFVSPGTLHDAHELGRLHCDVMGFHFHYVKPFLSNFKEDEKRKLRQFGTGPLGETKDAVGADSRSS